jgi:hypothetical protein
MSDFTTSLLAVIGAVAVVLVIGFLMSWPVMMLWNGCLVDAVSVVKPIGWLQAYGITILASLLFKSTTTTKGK